MPLHLPHCRPQYLKCQLQMLHEAHTAPCNALTPPSLPCPCSSLTGILRGGCSPLRWLLVLGGCAAASYSSGSNLGAAIPAVARLARCTSAHSPDDTQLFSNTSLSLRHAMRTGSDGSGLNFLQLANSSRMSCSRRAGQNRQGRVRWQVLLRGVKAGATFSVWSTPQPG